MTVRQISVDFPAAQSVFRRYGEPDDRPGKFGHLEPLTHFARRRKLALERLLAELSAATGVPLEIHSQCAERIHRPFVLAALAVTLTLGAGWGGWLLWQIGLAGNFDAASAGAVVAHGEAQLWGFIVLMIMGISLRTVLKAAPRRPWGLALSRLLLALGLAGTAGGFAWFVAPAAWPGLGAASAAALLAMALVFCGLQVGILKEKWPATWARSVMISGCWLVTWAGVTVAMRLTAGSSGPNAYAPWQRLVLIELAVFGFAMNSIYGFGQMLLPGLLRIGNPRTWALEITWWAHNLGTAGICASTVWPKVSGLAPVAAALVAGGAIFYAIGQRGFIGKQRTSYRLQQGHPVLDFYPPLAFFWLVTSLLLLAGGYAWGAMTGQLPLPHAFVGAIRHALTVGFMTTLILGVGQRLVPVLEHRVLPLPRLVIPILLLVGVGNLSRVASELAILGTPAAYALMPFSAILEWTALWLFAIGMVATMWHVDPLLRRGRVTAGSSVAILLAEHPEIEDWLISKGYAYLARTRSVPQELTLGALAEGQEDGLHSLLEAINRRLQASPAQGCAVSSPSCSS